MESGAGLTESSGGGKDAPEEERARGHQRDLRERDSIERDGQGRLPRNWFLLSKINEYTSFSCPRSAHGCLDIVVGFLWRSKIIFVIKNRKLNYQIIPNEE